MVTSVILLLDLIHGGGQRKGIVWKGTRAWSGDMDKDSDFVLGDRKAGIAFLAQVSGDQVAQDGGWCL